MGEKTKGRKRHIVVDVLGCMLSVDVHAANIHDTKSGIFTAKEAYTINGKNFPGVGLLNVLFLGSIIPEDSLKIMNFPSLFQNLWPLFLTYTLC